MKYKLANQDEADKAFLYLTKLVGSSATAEIKKVNPNRSLSQNKYYHMLLGVLGIATGYTIEEAKLIHKRVICPELFLYEKKGNKFLKSSADLSKDQMNKAIDRLLAYGRENDIDMPLTTEADKIIYYQNLIESQGKWL